MKEQVWIAFMFKWCFPIASNKPFKDQVFYLLSEQGALIGYISVPFLLGYA